MTTFDERERAFENMFAHDEESRFLTLVRRNQLLARWAAEMIGFRGSECQSYVRTFVAGAVQGESEDMLFQRMRSDFLASGTDTSDAAVRAAITRASVDAERQVRTGTRIEGAAPRVPDPDFLPPRTQQRKVVS
jgi:hypothetical protein